MNYPLKHIQNISPDEADINLFSEIGGENGISGQEFADEIKLLNDFGVKTINIHTASVGGVVTDGLVIFSAINNSEAFVNIFIEGVAASMGSIIAMAGDRIHMSDISQIMIHDPHGGDPDDENTQKALKALRESLLVALKNRATISESKLSALMSEETWISPKDALEMGLIDEIIETKKSKMDTRKKKQSKAAITDILNKNSNNNNNKNDMKNIAKHLGLNDEALESAIIDAIKTIESNLEQSGKDLTGVKDELKESDKKVTALETEVATFKSEAEKIEDQLVEETIEQGIKDNKFDKDAKEDLVAEFKGNLSSLKMIMGKVKTKAPDIAGLLKGSAGGGTDSKLPESLAKLTWKEADKLGKTEEMRAISEAEWNGKYKAEHGKDHPQFVEAV